MSGHYDFIEKEFKIYGLQFCIDLTKLTLGPRLKGHSEPDALKCLAITAIALIEHAKLLAHMIDMLGSSDDKPSNNIVEAFTKASCDFLHMKGCNGLFVKDSMIIGLAKIISKDQGRGNDEQTHPVEEG